MRRLLTAVLLGAALLLAGTAAQALPFSGSFTFQMGTLPPVTFGASGSGSLAGTEIASGGIVPGTETVGVDSFAPFTQIEVIITGNGTGDLPGPLSVRGTLELRGGGTSLATVPFFTGAAGRTAGGATGVSAGLGVGNTIQITNDFGTLIQIFNDSWTTGVASTQLVHTPESASAPTSASASGFRSSTPGGQGRLIAVEVAGYSSSDPFQNQPLFATLDLTYTPEPGTGLLLGAGVAGLALVGGRRMRR